jgi:hypothetical protein
LVLVTLVLVMVFLVLVTTEDLRVVLFENRASFVLVGFRVVRVAPEDLRVVLDIPANSRAQRAR